MGSRSSVACPNRRGLPGYLRKLLQRGLSVDPSHRFASMDEFLAAWEKGRRRATVLFSAAIVLSVSLVGALLASWQHVRQQQILRCEGAADQLSGGWNPALQTELLNRLQTHASLTPGIALRQRFEQFASYSNAVRAAYVDTCVSLSRLGTAQASQRAQEVSCLELRLSIVRELMERFRRGEGQNLLLDQTLQAMRDLPALEDCQGTPIAQTSSDADAPRRNEEVEQRVILDITRAYRLLAAGDYEQASSVAWTAAGVAKLSGARQSWTEALWLHGVLSEHQQEYVKAESAFHHLLVAALEQRQDRLAVMACTSLARTVGQGLHRLDEGKRFTEFGQALLLRIGQPLLLGIELDLVRGTLLQMSGDHRSALSLHLRALDGLKKAHGSDSVELLGAMRQIASDYRALAEFSSAEQWFLDAHHLAQQAYGDLHPETIRLLIETGVAASRLHRFGEALKRCEIANQHLDQLPMRADFLTGQILSCRAEAAINLGHCATAIRDFRHTLAIDERRFGHQSKEVATDLAGLGTALAVCHGSVSEALPALEESLRLATTLVFPPRHVALIQLELASALASEGAAGRRKRALAESAYQLLKRYADDEQADKDLVEKAASLLRDYGWLAETKRPLSEVSHR